MNEESSCRALVVADPHPSVEPPTTEDAVSVLEEIKNKLANITNLAEAKELADQAEAFRHYVKRARRALEVQNQCAYVKVCAERRAGQLLIDMGLSTGRPEKTSTASILSDLKISRNQSSRWQALARVPVELIADWKKGCDACREDFTSAYVWRMVKGVIPREEYVRATHPDDAESRLDANISRDSWARAYKQLTAFHLSLQGKALWADLEMVLTDQGTLTRYDLNLLAGVLNDCHHETGRAVEAVQQRIDKQPVEWEQTPATDASEGTPYLDQLLAFSEVTKSIRKSGHLFDFSEDEHDLLHNRLGELWEHVNALRNGLWTIRAESRRIREGGPGPANAAA